MFPFAVPFGAIEGIEGARAAKRAESSGVTRLAVVQVGGYAFEATYECSMRVSERNETKRTMHSKCRKM